MTVHLSSSDLARHLGLHAPTEEQARIVEAPLEPMVVIAGAGSGKTETMAARVVWLVANGLVRPEEILGLTFTRKAAGELADRIGSRLRLLRRKRICPAGTGGDLPRIATYNAYAGALVTEYGLAVGADPAARLLTEAGRWQVGSHVVETWPGDVGTEAAPRTVTKAVLALAGALAEHLLEPEGAAADLRDLADSLLDRRAAEGSAGGAKPRAEARDAAASLRARADLMDLVAAFARRKAALGLLDFADQVALANRIARSLPGVRATERAAYRVVLLDEYQDTSVAQTALLATIFADGHPVTAVGDPHQAIYGWRGASAGAIGAFPNRFPRVASDGARGPSPVLTLATSWRNDLAVLGAANRIAAALRSPAAGPGRSGTLPELRARPGVGPGRVLALYAETAVEEADRVAAFVAREWAGDGEAHPTAAVLCRVRSQMPLIAESLRRAGLPVEVIGLGGLLGTPEVRDLHAALQLADDPGRGDAAMRLLTGLRLGISDLEVLYEHARNLAGKEAGPGGEASLGEAIERPPAREWTTARGRRLSAAARSRVERLAAALRALRAESHLPLPELVATAERHLGLDIEVLARSGGGPGHARRHLDAFTEAAAEFSAGSQAPTLGAFLAWLEAAEEYERGLDTLEAEPDRAAVQVLTVHAAKGLEWDVVAVPGLREGVFPSYPGSPDPVGAPTPSDWLKDLAALPYPLRGDAEDLPSLDLAGPADHSEMAAELLAFKERAGRHLIAEERRLAYVALTRARRALLLSGSWWKEDAATPRPPARFLSELVRSGEVAVADDDPWLAPREQENPLGDRASVRWPAERDPAVQERFSRAAAAVRTAPPRPGESPSARAAAWWVEAELLLAEEDRRGEGARAVVPPAHLSASSVVALVSDPVAFALDRRRPVPRRPTVQARRGTRFHAWVERHFGAAALLDVDDLPGSDEMQDPELDALRDAFLASTWADRRPLAVEADLETPVAGVMIRCRVDAVFAAPGGAVEVVDWKTGPPAHDEAEIRARQMQLAVYRLAWSRLNGLPLDRVGARFVHVGHGAEVAAEPLDEAGILAAVREHLRASAVPPAGSRR